MPATVTPLRLLGDTARCRFGFEQPRLHGAAAVRAECVTYDQVGGGRYAGLELVFLNRHGRPAPMTIYFEEASTAYAHALARAINAVPPPWVDAAFTEPAE